LNQRNNFTQGDPTPLGSYSVNDDGEAVIPGGSWLSPPLPGGDPGLDTYHYPEPETERSEPHREWSAAYPGTLVGYQTRSKTVARSTTSMSTGTGSEAGGDDRVPVHAARHPRSNPAGGRVRGDGERLPGQKDEDTGNDSFVVERTFVIPIWLR
jgi:hypothetical protein